MELVNAPASFKRKDRQLNTEARHYGKTDIPALACAAKDDVIPVHVEMRLQFHSLSKLTS